MKIVVFWQGGSAQREMCPSRQGEMVTKALRENGHQVILLDVFYGI